MDVIERLDRATITETHQVRRKTRDKPDKGDGHQPLTTRGKKKAEARQLKKKLEEIAEQNESLSKVITDKNVEIADLKRSVQSLSEVLNSVPIDELRCNSSIASSKLLEMSKKNRQLRAELETSKTRLNKKDLQIQKLERELRLVEEKFHIDAEEVRKTHDPADELRSKLSNLQQKFFEARNRNTELQAQLKLAQKCLQQEVGEHFNLNTLVAQPQNSNWRGRAQHIIHLQQKLHELKERLELYEQHTSDGRPITGYNNGENVGPIGEGRLKGTVRTNNQTDSMSMPNTSTTSIDRLTTGVRKTELLHRAKVEALEKEIESLKAQLEDQRGKVLALKVRNKTLNDDVMKYRMKASTLEEQTDYNGLNLASMNEKMNTQRYHYEGRLEDMVRQLNELKRVRKETEFREEESRLKLNNMESLLETKDSYIEELNNVIKKLEIDLKALSGGFLFSCRELRKEEFIAILDSLEAEKNQLLEHNKTLTERTEHERSKNESLNEQLSKQKIRIARLEARVRELEKELEMQMERKKRTQRISEYVNSMTSLSTTAASLNSFVFENSATVKNIGSKPFEELKPAQVNELRNQLEYAKEKLTFLEEKITHLKEEKENDARAFDKIINNSRNIILETLLENKSNCETNLNRSSNSNIN